jgi:hypothetical protein
MINRCHLIDFFRLEVIRITPDHNSDDYSLQEVISERIIHTRATCMSLYARNMMNSEDTLRSIVDELVGYFLLNKDLLKTVCDSADFLEYISEKKGLPYVTSFQDLHRFVSMERDDLVHYAATGGDLRVLKHHLLKDEDSFQFLMSEAAHEGQLNTVEYLFTLVGDDMDVPYEAMCNAASQGHMEIVKFLVEGGVNTHEIVSVAAEVGNFEMVDYLISKGCNLDCSVAWAAGANNRKMVDHLISKGADLEGSILHAQLEGHQEMVEYLSSIGAVMPGME